MKEKPSITDWIQAGAVVIGVIFGIWEFVLHDRTLESQKKKSVTDLIISGQNEEIRKSSKIIMKYLKDEEQKITDDNIVDFMISISPLEGYYDSWGFCYNSNLCDKKLVIDYICSDLLIYTIFSDKLKRKNTNNYITNSPKKLIKECEKSKYMSDVIESVKKRVK